MLTISILLATARRYGRHLGRRSLVAAVLLVLALASTPFLARALAALRPAFTAARVQEREEPDTRVIPANTDGVFLLVINPLGISHDELTFQAGVHHLVVSNSAALQDQDLTLQVRNTASRDQPATLTLRAGEFKHLDLTLEAGEYTVTESAHPDKVFQVHVVP